MGRIRKEIIIENKGRIVKRIGFFLAIAFAVAGLWKVSVSETTRPAERITDHAFFMGEDSEIRSIYLYLGDDPENIKEVSRFTVSLFDQENKLVYKTVCKNVPLMKENWILLEEFEKAEGIKTSSQQYRVESSLEQIADLAIQYKVIYHQGSYFKLYMGAALVALIALFVVLVMSFRQSEKKLPVYFVIAFVLMGILYSIVMPPLSVVDEESHFMRSYNLASKMLFDYETDIYGNPLIRKTDADAITYLHNAASIERWYHTFWDREDPKEKVSYTKRISVPDTTPVYTYMIPALGIVVGRLFSLNGHWVLLLGRFFNLFLIAFILAAAIKKIPFGKKLFCVIALLPEVVFLAASYSYDGLNLALCVLAISYFFYLTDKEEVNAKDLAILFLITIIMIPIKMVYFPFLFLLGAIPIKRWNIPQKTMRIGIIGILLIIVAVAIWRQADVVVLLKGLVYNTKDSEMVSVSFVLHNPKSAIKVLLNTLLRNLDYYLQSIIGEFVAYNKYRTLYSIHYPTIWMMIIVGILVTSAIYTDRKNTISRLGRGWLLCILLGSGLMILSAMYFANNTIDMPQIHGVQGRYFIPLLFLLPAIFGRNKDSKLPIEFGLSSFSYITIMTGIDVMLIVSEFQYLAVHYYD